MVRHLATVATSRLVASLAQGVTLLLIARHVDPMEFGIFAAIFGVLQVLQVLSDGGSSTALMRYFEQSEIVRGLFVLSSRGGWLAAAVSLGGLLVGAGTTSSSVFLELLPLSVWVLTERQCEVRSAYLMAVGRTAPVGVTLAARRILTGVAVVLFATNVGPFLVFAIGMAATSSAGALILLNLSARHLSATSAGSGGPTSNSADRKGQALRRSFSIAKPYWSSSVAQSVRQFDTAILSVVAGPAASAGYAPASRLLPPLLLVPGTYSQLLLSRLVREKRRIRWTDTIFPVLFSLIGYGVLAYTAPLWVVRVLGPAYSVSVAPLQIVLGGLVLATLRGVLTADAQVRGDENIAARAAWTGGLGTLALVAVLGAWAGAVGAAWATALGFALQTLLLLWNSDRSGTFSPFGESPHRVEHRQRTWSRDA